jgi:hypothetical protein
MCCLPIDLWGSRALRKLKDSLEITYVLTSVSIIFPHWCSGAGKWGVATDCPMHGKGSGVTDQGPPAPNTSHLTASTSGLLVSVMRL